MSDKYAFTLQEVCTILATHLNLTFDEIEETIFHEIQCEDIEDIFVLEVIYKDATETI